MKVCATTIKGMQWHLVHSGFQSTGDCRRVGHLDACYTIKDACYTIKDACYTFKDACYTLKVA